MITVGELKILIEYKSGKNAPSKENKPALITRWNNVKNNDTNDLTMEGIPKWTLEDVNETTKCKNENLTLFDTEVGKQARARMCSPQQQGLGNCRWIKLLKHVRRTILNYYDQLLLHLMRLFLPITIPFIKWNKYDMINYSIIINYFIYFVQ